MKHESEPEKSQEEIEQNRRSGWYWWCHQGQKTESVSVLSLFETLAAMSVYILIALYWGTLHLLISGCLAPALLLRTEESVALGRKLGAKFLHWGPVVHFNG